MTGAALRWKRILKVRSVQRQMADVQLHRCETELRNLVGLGTRIAAIRDGAQPSAGAQSALMLRSICELSGRLDSARLALVNPSQNAIETRDRQQRLVIAAKQRETAVEKLDAAKSAQEVKRAHERASRAAIVRNIPKIRGML